jgi:membrane protein DedA with SNARE-associated domain
VDLQHWVLTLSGSPWVYLLVYLFCLLDGFFPPVPSETIVIALAATWASVGQPHIALLWLVATLGAFTGDQIAYAIGRRSDVRSWRAFRHPRGAAALEWARRSLHGRGVSFILTARFVPVGRVAVNMTAGAVHYPRRRFVPIVGLSAALWAGYGVAIGAFSGRWFQDNPVLAVVVGIVAGLLLGLVLDSVVRRTAGVPAARRRQDSTGDASADGDDLGSRS